MKYINEDVGKSEVARMLAGLIFRWGLAGNADSDAAVLGEAVGQIQHALPRSAGRAWRRECLASLNRVNRGPAILLRSSGRVVVQCRVPGSFMTGLQVGEQAIAWRLGEVVRKRTGRAWPIARIARGART